jgi:dihydroxy-acid dehydratase
MVYGGTIRAGCTARARKLDIVSAFQSYGEYLAGRSARRNAGDRAPYAAPAKGACGGMYTANTMASAIEALGMSLPYSSSYPAESPRSGRVPRGRRSHAPAAGARHQAQRHHDPRRVRERHGRRHGPGRLTNAVLHLIAMAKAVDVPLTIDDFQAVSDRTPFLADLKPSGRS